MSEEHNTNQEQETVDTLQEEAVQEINVDYKDKWMRAHADYQNLVKESAAQRAEWAKMSEIHILEEFIPVYENFKKAFAMPVDEGDKQFENWKKGIEYIKKQFADILTQHDVEEIPTVGQAFDPAIHEALSEEASDDHEDGMVIRELSGGYKVGERILQAAKVVVCKK